MRKRRKILYIIDSSETGGAESIFFSLVQNTDSKMYDVVIGLLYDGWLKEKLNSNGYSPVMFPSKKGGFDYIFFLHLLNFLWREKIDLVCAHLFTASLYASVAGRLLKVPVISVFHGVMDVSDSDKYSFVKFGLLNYCTTKIVFVSKFLSDYFNNKYSVHSNKAVIIYNGVVSCHSMLLDDEKQFLRTKLGVSQNELLVLAVGDTHLAKDYPTLIKSISIALKRISNLKLVVAGRKTDHFPELESLVAELGLTRKIQFLGYCDATRELFAASDLYVSSSISEGFSLTLVEAMMEGVPVVATKSGGPQEIVENGKTGVLVPVASPATLADIIVKLCEDSSTRNYIAKHGQIHAKVKFGFEVMIAGYEQLFKEVVK